jgi:hypothetical protein
LSLGKDKKDNNIADIDSINVTIPKVSKNSIFDMVTFVLFMLAANRIKTRHKNESG